MTLIAFGNPSFLGSMPCATRRSVSVVFCAVRPTGVSWFSRIRLGPFPASACLHANRLCVRVKRFARADKRAKLPRWINQYITETASNLSTDMAITLSKLFMRTISQNPNENQTGISLWTLEDIEKHQAKQKELAIEAEKEAEKLRENVMDVDDEDYGDGGFDDNELAQIDLDL